jgi:hypothetical protein
MATRTGTGPDGVVSGRSMTHRIADNLCDLAKSLDPPAPLHQPTADDLGRYQNLLADRGIRLDTFTVEAALARPELLTTPAFDAVSPPRRLPELTARTYAQQAGWALGQRTAVSVTRAAGWGMLQVVLRRAEIAGHDPQTLLASVPTRSGLAAVADPAAVLARRVTRYLGDHPTPRDHRHRRHYARWTGLGLEPPRLGHEVR